jgi:hypothetical protein
LHARVILKEDLEEHRIPSTPLLSGSVIVPSVRHPPAQREEYPDEADPRSGGDWHPSETGAGSAVERFARGSFPAVRMTEMEVRGDTPNMTGKH